MMDDIPVLFDFHFTTIGGSLSLSAYVAAFIVEIKRRGMTYHLHAFGTNVEGHLVDLLDLARWVITHLRSVGERRIFLDIRVTTRFDRDQNLAEKMGAVTGLVVQS